jgi:hypothetical protein
MNVRALLPPAEGELEPSGLGDAWQRADWQRMWLATQRSSWRSLALVLAGSGAPLEFTLKVAVSLARTGMRHLGGQVHVADATQLGMAHAVEFGQQLRRTIESGPVIIALASPSTSAVAIELAQAADYALLCVLLGQMRISEAKKTLDDIGRERFLGAVTFG